MYSEKEIQVGASRTQGDGTIMWPSWVGLWFAKWRLAHSKLRVEQKLLGLRLEDTAREIDFFTVDNIFF